MKFQTTPELLVKHLAALKLEEGVLIEVNIPSLPSPFDEEPDDEC